MQFNYGVKFRTINEDDLGQLRSWRNTREIRQWCRQYDLISEQDQRKWFEGLRGDQTRKMFVVCVDPEHPVGVCGLTSIDYINRKAEFSIYIDPKKHGLGYGKNALKTLLAFGFNNMNLNSIWGEVFNGNPSFEVFKSIGFRESGRLRESYFRDGKYIDSIFVDILKGEFEC